MSWIFDFNFGYVMDISCCFESQFRFYVSDTVNASSAESVKEPVIGSSLEAKQDDTGEVLASICMLKLLFVVGNDCVCCRD